jgi:glycolate oxidase FAD binding subunit
MSGAAFDRLAAALGDAVTQDPSGLPRVAPRSTDGLAAALGIAHDHHWRVRIEGRSTWMPADAPADLAVTTARLDRITSIAPQDLVATVQAGVTIRELGRQLGGHRTWLALDPPGSPDRSLGSVLATGTAGPVRHRFGPVRDHVLGTAVVTSDGRVIRSGGIVVKNVAGFDLTKIQIGGFGAFGVIAEINVRLRTLPGFRQLLVAAGDLDPLFHAGRALVEANLDAEMVELVSPAVTGGPDWLLVVTIAGTEVGVAAEAERARSTVPDRPLDARPAGSLNSAIAQAFGEGAVTLRAGSLPASTPDLVDLFAETVGAGRIGASLGRGGIRWSGTPSAPAILRLRAALAEREIPLTVERAPWPIRSAVGHFGPFREGAKPLTRRVRDVFDPGRLLVAALEGSDDA